MPAIVSRYGDLLVPAAVIMMVVMMVIPLPPVVLDLLLASTSRSPLSCCS